LSDVIKIERFCQCGERLNAKADHEDDARAKLEAFLHEHIGREDDGTVHAPMRRGDYWRMVRRLNEELRKSNEMEARRQLEAMAKLPGARRYKIK
jgi:hypothetical protein